MAFRVPLAVLMALTVLMVSTVSAPTGPDTSPVQLGQQVHPDGLTILSGDGQGGLPATRLHDPLTVILIESDAPLSGETVHFEISGNGTGSLEGGGHAGPAVDVGTDAEGKASVHLSTGTTVGPITVSASWENESVEFTCHSVSLQPMLSIWGANRTGVNTMFDARDSAGEDLKFIFDYGDGSTSGLQTSPTAVHQYTSPGRYVVGLTVVGNHGVNHSTYKELRIAEDTYEETLDPLAAWIFLVVALLLLFATLYIFSRSLLKEAMSRIRTQDPKAKEDKYDMAVSLALAGEGDRALRYFKAVLDEDPTHAKAHFYKGVVLMDQNKLKAAQRSFNEALVHDPDNAPAMKALDAVETAIRLNERIGGN